MRRQKTKISRLYSTFILILEFRMERNDAPFEHSSKHVPEISLNSIRSWLKNQASPYRRLKIGERYHNYFNTTSSQCGFSDHDH